MEVLGQAGESRVPGVGIVARCGSGLMGVWVVIGHDREED